MSIEQLLKKEAAQALKGEGFNLMPVRDNKRPFLREWKIRQDIGLTRLELDNLLSRHDLELAILGGQTRERIANVLIIDVDDPELLDRVLAIQNTRMISTTNDGFHAYYQLPLDQFVTNSVKLGGMDIDLRNQGAYGVAPPSIIDGVRREWMHGILAADAIPFFPLEMLVEVPKVAATRDTPNIEAKTVTKPTKRYPVRAVRNPRAYCLRVQSIQGQNGSASLTRCVAVCRDSGLCPAETIDFLVLEWNPACARPEWSVAEITHCVRRLYAQTPAR